MNTMVEGLICLCSFSSKEWVQYKLNPSNESGSTAEPSFCLDLNELTQCTRTV